MDSHGYVACLRRLTLVMGLLWLFGPLQAQDSGLQEDTQHLVIGIAGTAPFIDSASGEGISVEIWQALATKLDWHYRLETFDDVQAALEAMKAAQVDMVVGPVSITAERARAFRFTQPYYQSSLSILSRTDQPTLWDRISPFFSQRFFVAVVIFLLILGGVGTLLWLAERKHNPEQFPLEPGLGIANGMWCAIVTMSTTGYGDRSPVSFWGRMIAACWMVISIIFATTMVAGIASTLTLTGMNNSVISTADDMTGKKVAVVAGSPAAAFVKPYGVKATWIGSLQEGYDMLKSKKVDAVVYDRPQLFYFLRQHRDHNVAVSTAEYVRQGYGFALPLGTRLLHRMNVTLLSLEESGQVDRMVDHWLGKEGR